MEPGSKPARQALLPKISADVGVPKQNSKVCACSEIRQKRDLSRFLMFEELWRKLFLRSLEWRLDYQTPERTSRGVESAEEYDAEIGDFSIRQFMSSVGQNSMDTTAFAGLNEYERENDDSLGYPRSPAEKILRL